MREAMREKRIFVVKAHLTPSLGERLAECVEEQGRVVSMSDYLFELIEEHVAMKAIRVSKQRITRGVTNS